MIVTKEELEQIRELAYNDNCITIYRVIDQILSRPESLALLEAWFNERSVTYWKTGKLQGYLEFAKMLKAIRTNPSAVREQGIRDGWWKE